MLKLKEGWEVSTDYATGWDWIHRSDAEIENSFAACSSKGLVIAYPFGGRELEDSEFDSIEAAHEFLIALRSESPWYDAPDARVTGLDEFQRITLRTAGDIYADGWIVEKLLGLSEEVGETLGLIKKAEFHGRELDRDALKKELGDVLWYLSTIARFFNLTLSDVATANVEKLRKRYPQGFNVEASRNRKD